MVTKRHLQRTQKFTNRSTNSIIKLMGSFSKLSRVLNVSEKISMGQKSTRGRDPGACKEQKGNVQRGTDGSALIYQNTTNHKSASSELHSHPNEDNHIHQADSDISSQVSTSYVTNKKLTS